MSKHSVKIVARWPHTPIGTRVEVEAPESYDLSGYAYELNQVVGELWKGTPAALVVRALGTILNKLFRK